MPFKPSLMRFLLIAGLSMIIVYLGEEAQILRIMSALLSV